MSENSATNLRELTREEVELKLQDLCDELQNLKLRSGLQQEQNPVRMRLIRRGIARAKTLLHEDAKGIHTLARGEGK